MAFIHNKIPLLNKQKLIRKSIIMSLNNNTNYNSVISPLNGIEVGIPIMIFTDIYTNLHYGYSINNLSIIFFQIVTAYFVYGRDRYKDAIEYKEKENNVVNYKKHQLYKTILDKPILYEKSHSIAFALIIEYLLNTEYWKLNIPFILLIISTEFYPQFKKNYGNLKPFYISIMWTISTLILPSVLHDHNYDILLSPIDYLPIFFSIFATSNIADIIDIEEDKENGIETFTIKAGMKKSLNFTLISLLLSSILLGSNDNYFDRPIINGLLELQNAVTSITLLPYIYNITI